jgi:Arc/MetJ-type ribon-helix-helix transcriptional regulator
MSKDGKSKIVSLSLDPEMHEVIRDAAKKLGHKNVSQVIRDLVSKYLSLLVNDADEIPVIIRVPNSLTEDPERLRGWLAAKAEAIADALE